jgi:small-conductance mechanosensitive channel
MKSKIWAALAIVLIIALIGAAFGFRLFRFEDGHLLFRTLEEDAAELLNKPYFSVGDFPVTPITLVKALIYLLAIGFAARWFSGFLHRQILVRTKLDEGQQYTIRRVTQYLILLIGVVIGLEAVGLNLASLAVFGGALGIGIGFGLQETANNFIAGLILLLERPVKVGDRVEVGAVDGEVVRIGARATWVRTNDNIVIVIPNSAFVTKEVINWTANDRKVRFLVPFGVSYSSNPDQVREIVLGVARRNKDVLDTPAPDVIFTGFGDSSIDFELRVWTTTQIHRRPVIRSDIYFEIFRAFRENGVEIPFPQRDLHLRSSDVPLTSQVAEPQQ